MNEAKMIPYSTPNSPIAFDYPSDWILVTYPPLQPGGAFFDLHNRISALESIPREDTGLGTYKSGDFSLRLLVYRDGWMGNPYLTIRSEAQRLYQYHYSVGEPEQIRLGEREAAQVAFSAPARDGAFAVFALDAGRWVLASLAAASGGLAGFLPVAHTILQTVVLRA